MAPIYDQSMITETRDLSNVKNIIQMSEMEHLHKLDNISSILIFN
jgi:hypothetical protein